MMKARLCRQVVAAAAAAAIFVLLTSTAFAQTTRAEERGGPHPLDRFSSQLRWNPGFMIQAA